MWTGIIVVIAFCLGFFLLSLPACAKAADVEIELMRIITSSGDGQYHHHRATESRTQMNVASLPGGDSYGAG